MNYDIFSWNYTHLPVDDNDTWDTQDRTFADTWKAGASLNWWSSALERLRTYSY